MMEHVVNDKLSNQWI